MRHHNMTGCVVIMSVVVFLSSATSTNISISGSVSKKVFTMTIFNENYNWFQAFDHCKQAGFQKMVDSMPGRDTFEALTQYLRDSGYASETATFWTNSFRPFRQTVHWYKSYNCDPNNVVDSYSVPTSDGQCAVIYYQNTSGYDNPMFQAKDCYRQYPFICFLKNRDKDFLSYEGYAIIQSNPTFFTLSFTYSNEGECKSKCYASNICALYSYNNTDGECLIKKVPDGYGKVDYILTTDGSNVTQGVHDGMYSIMTETAHPTSGDVDMTFPDCNVSVIPEDYCPCGITDETFEDILKEMETDRKSTTKEKLRYRCAEDDRASSKAIGALGVIVIGVLISVIVGGDIITLVLETDKRIPL